MLLEALGLCVSEIFDYNRENYTYDREQRLKRDMMRVEMQIARFDLFRQDLEDLVKLTVDKMDMYHLIGALFLAFSTLMYAKGRIHGTVVPPFYLGAYFLSIAGAFSYLLLAVWLSMHASVSSHSFGVRIRTRHVRLPIPSLSQIASLTTSLTDFERTGVGNILRLPFVGRDQIWQVDTPTTGASSTSVAGLGRLGCQQGINSEDLLGSGERPFVGEAVSTGEVAGAAGQHVKLFRKLQAKWQCFDAYARVCMSLGACQVVQSICYYLIGVCAIKLHSFSVAIALVFIFQMVVVALSILDVVKMRNWQILCMRVTGLLPTVITVVAVSLAERDDTHGLSLRNEYFVGPSVFFVEALWFEFALWVAWPSDDASRLPRRFRAVLFLDASGQDTCDPTDEEVGVAATSRSVVHERSAAFAEHLLSNTWCALRRWEGVPTMYLSQAQRQERKTLRKEFVACGNLLKSTLNEYNASCGRPPNTSVDSLLQRTSWEELSDADRAGDLFAHTLLGPLPGEQAFDLEGVELRSIRKDFSVLTLDDVAKKLQRAKGAVRLVRSEMEQRRSPTTPRATTTPRADHDLEDNRGLGPARNGSRLLRGGDSRSNLSDGSDGTVAGRVDDLPWKMVHRMTRVLQLCWLFMGTTKVVELQGIFKGDHAQRRHGADERRLASAPFDAGSARMGLAAEMIAIREMNLGRVEVRWPYGPYFRPTSLSCLPSPGSAGKGDVPESTARASAGRRSGLAHILLGSSSAQYRLSSEARGHGLDVRAPLELQPALPRSVFPPGAVALCAQLEDAESSSPSSSGCLWGAIDRGGVALWTVGHGRVAPRVNEFVVLPVKGGRPWRHFTGASLRCRDVALLLPPDFRVGDKSGAAPGDGWCLVLVGWDGLTLPVAILPLSGGPAAPPDKNSSIVAYFAAPLSTKSRRRRCHEGGSTAQAACDGSVDIVALHVQPHNGRLWVLEGGDELWAWDLPRLQTLGHWRLRSGPDAADVRLAAVCEDPRENRLIFVASGLTGRGGPALLQTPLPLQLERRSHVGTTLAVHVDVDRAAESR